MSKVLVDREMLNDALKTIHGLAPGRFAVEEELRAAVTAQPAEAEGVEVVATVHIGDPCPETGAHDDLELLPEDCEFYDGECLVRQSDHLAALSAVTAERDDLRLQVEAARSVCTESQGAILGLIAERDQLRAEVEALRTPIAEVVSKYGDPEAFGERELKVLADIQRIPYGTKLYAAMAAKEA